MGLRCCCRWRTARSAARPARVHRRPPLGAGRQAPPGFGRPRPTRPGARVLRHGHRRRLGRTELATGDRVGVELHHRCGACPRCRAGEYDICRYSGFAGLVGHGGPAEYARSPRTWHTGCPARCRWSRRPSSNRPRSRCTRCGAAGTPTAWPSWAWARSGC
ncbi:alcohol dehydrogenase catalytic domain-containing protein [Streptomyces sp. SudanB182_2057]|uniref:alcohol dehydrogenase catalytic domain-containing protein n=1 Tax=Streptomyces sp. SudanB182_2057 TaxID=3035281 RepID=UPI003F550EDA